MSNEVLNSKSYKKIVAELVKSKDIYETEKLIKECKAHLNIKRFLFNEEKIVLDKRNRELNYKTDASIKSVNKIQRTYFNRRETFLNPFKYCVNKVQNRLGSDVSFHFQFNSWIILHNIITFLFILLPFLCIPHIIMVFDDIQYSSQVLSTTNNTNNSTYLKDSGQKKLCQLITNSIRFNALDLLVADVNNLDIFNYILL
jgi:hypothetical protein